MKSFFKKLISFIVIVAVFGGAGYLFFSKTDLLSFFLSRTYTVSFDANGGTFDGETIKEIEVEKNGVINLPKVSKEGYLFDGWYFGVVVWDETREVKRDIELVAKWIPKQYKITFVVDGVSHDRMIDYDSMPTFNGSTEKTPTNTISYVFEGWEPALSVVKGEATYTATYKEVLRKYNIYVGVSPEGFGTAFGAGQFEWLSDTTISVVPNEGYELEGWYLNDELYSTELSFDLIGIDDDCTFIAKIVPKKYKITFVVDGVSHDQMIDYNSMPEFDGDTSKTPTNTVIYTFKGWEPTLSIVKGEATYTATYTQSVRKYDIEVEMSPEDAGTVSGAGQFLWLDDTTISVVPNEGYEFLGWYLNDELYSSELSFELTDIDNDYVFVAMLIGDERTVAFSVDGMALDDDTIETSYGEIVTEPDINTTKYGMSGYKIVGWYLDEACTEKFTFGEALLKNVQLYGKWQYMMNNGFYSYLSKFNNAKTSSKLVINSMTELVAWVEYVQFYNITTQYPLSLNFSYSGIMSTLEQAINQSRYPSNAKTSYSSLGRIYITSSYRSAESNLKNADADNSEVLPQQDFAYALGEQTSRADEFDDFNIKNVVQTLEVETSNQLVYALEVGLEPICKTGSPAENVMNKAKQVLRDICTNDMDEVTKLRAIYEWLILNVAYDNDAADLAIADEINWQEYDAWYAEGVFNNGKAVCDGLAKAFLILAKLENIPTIRISGENASGVGHAWNKVYLNGEWYGVDATHGNPSIDGEFEMLTYTNFLFTDTFKTAEGYTQIDYTNIVADAVFNIYDAVSYNNLGEFDWVIDSNIEYVKLLQYVKNYQKSEGSTYYSVEIVIADGLTLEGLHSYASNYYNLSINSYVPFNNSTIGKTVYSLLIA